MQPDIDGPAGGGPEKNESGSFPRRIQRPSNTKPIRSKTMKRYKLKTPRIAIGVAAFVMTAVTFGVSVVVPAQVASASFDAARFAEATATEVAIAPSRIDVVAEREAATTVGSARNLSSRKGQPG
jgi:hypothetical protein